MDRFWSKVSKTDDCWLWMAYINSDGYGMFKFQNQMRLAHGVAWLLTCGDIPEGLELDHLCRVRHCVNPSHLEPVTHRENMVRGLAGAWQRATTHCPQNHEYTAENTRVYRGGRTCRICDRNRRRVERAGK